MLLHIRFSGEDGRPWNGTSTCLYWLPRLVVGEGVKSVIGYVLSLLDSLVHRRKKTHDHGAGLDSHDGAHGAKVAVTANEYNGEDVRRLRSRNAAKKSTSCVPAFSAQVAINPGHRSYCGWGDTPPSLSTTTASVTHKAPRPRHDEKQYRLL